MKYTFTLILTLVGVAGILTSMTSSMQTKDDKIRELEQQRDYWHNKWQTTMKYWKECENKLNTK